MLVARTLPPLFIVNASLRVSSLGVTWEESLRVWGRVKCFYLTRISLGTMEDFFLCEESLICKMFTGWLESPRAQGSVASIHLL